MRRIIRRLFLPTLALLLATTLAHANVNLTVDGLDDPLKSAVVSGVELSQYAKRDVSDAQIRRLYANAQDQVRKALQPYGYYEATVDGDLKQVGNDWQVTLHVKPGAPVKVISVDVALGAQTDGIKPIRRARQALQNLKGQTLNDGAYDSLRNALSAQLTANGFLGAKLVTHRVDVNRGNHSAAIHLAWKTGPRYRFGQVDFKGSQFNPGVLDRYVPFKQGDYFSQSDLLNLQQALNGADYFSVVNVLPDVNDAKNGTVDVTVQLVPAKRTIYTGGVFYGTDTGPGIRGGIERRWVNKRGHKWKNEIVAATRLKTLSTLYTVPMPGPNQRSFNYGAKFRDANTDTSTSRTLELVANETRQWYGWTRQLGVHALSGTFTVGKKGNESDNAPGVEHGRSTLLYVEASVTRKKADNFDFARRGYSVTFAARSTAGSLLSSTRFTQFTADAKWIRAFLGRNRLILSGSFGTTSVGEFSQLPPQLRFFAGGDRSIRGYSYQSVGPRNSFDRVIGGEDLFTVQTTVEHYFTRNWGMAAFVDAGNAFTGTNATGVIGAGLGVRWRSPVGMIRVDVGTPIHNNRKSGVQLHVVIGPDL